MGKQIQIDVTQLISSYQQGISCVVLSKQYKCSVWTIISRLREAGVRIRSSKEQNEIRLNLSPEVTEKFINLIDGLLLGDGSINFKKCLYLTQTGAREQWVLHVRGLFAEMGVFTTLCFRGPRDHLLEGRHIVEKSGVLLYSPAYVEMDAQRQRWYPEGKKIVPRDLRLTPLSIAHWFAGDGTYGSNGSLTFCTNGFIPEDTRWLASELSSIVGIQAVARETNRANQYVIDITRRDDAVKLRDFMLPFLSSCVHYKLQHIRPATYQRGYGRLSTGQVIGIRRMYDAKNSLSEIGTKYGISNSYVSSIGKRRAKHWVKED